MLRWLLFVPAVLLCSVLQAQPGFGPEIGIGMSTMRFAPAIGFTSATKASVFSGKIGGLVDASLNKKFYVQAGIFFSRRGQQRTFSFYTSDSLNGKVEQTLSLTYIDVPLMMIFKAGSQGRGRALLGIGAMPSYLIGGKNKLHQYGAESGIAFNNSSNNSVTADKPVGFFDIGINIIAGYELPTGMFIRAYYYSGIQDIGRGTEIDKNRMFGISAGWLFGKGRNINKEVDDLIDNSTD